jgi:hypothetical protein
MLGTVDDEDDDEYVASVQRLWAGARPATAESFALDANVVDLAGTINIDAATAILERLVETGRLERVPLLRQFEGDEPNEPVCYRVRLAG